MSLLTKENKSIDDWKPTPEQVKDLFQFLKNGAEKLVDKHSEGVSPIVAVMCLDPIEDCASGEKAEPSIRVHMIGGGFTTKHEKKLQMKRIAASIYKAKQVPLAVGLVSEAWCLIGKPGSANKGRDNLLDGHLLVSDHPERAECANVAVLGFHGPDEQGLSMTDLRLLKRINGTPESGPVDWDGDWHIAAALQKEGKPHEPTAGEGEANILEGFFWAFICFALKREDADHYLDGCQIEPLEMK